jgi:hypothetical protein
MMSKDELALLGLTEPLKERVLDSDEKVQKLEEEQTKDAEKDLTKWETVRREASEEANRHYLP